MPRDRNWMFPGRTMQGMGGAMDPVAVVRQIVVVMDHIARHGSPKCIPACTLPLTDRNVVDLSVTDPAVFRRADHASPFRSIGTAPGVTAQDVAARTTAAYVQ